MASPVSRAAGRRGLVAVVLIVLVLLVIADLLRRDSVLRGLFVDTPPSRQEQVIEGVRRTISMSNRGGPVISPEAPAEAETLAA